jgi:hypothetical protein
METILPVEIIPLFLREEGPSVTLEPLCELGPERGDDWARIWVFTQSIGRVGYGLAVRVHNRTLFARSCHLGAK